MTDLPIAVNTFVWHSPLTDELLATTLPQIAGWGFDAVELPLENIGDWDPGATSALLSESGLRCVVGAVFGPGRELAAADPVTIDDTKRYVRAAVDAAARVGAAMVIGPMYTSVGRTWRMSPPEREATLRELRDSLAECAEYAGQRGIALAVEPLNRYETSLLNTAAQTRELIEDLPGNVGLNLDTYHMNIEERDLRAAFRVAGDRLLHLQVCGNDRGAPGHDLQNWPLIRDCLAEISYRGMLGIESFTADNASIATAASIWRPLAESQDVLAVEGLRFLREWRDGRP
ncbi:sugar phosphate isomerase/epimerase family protein [Streptomyces iranensis]|uniref:D-psicose/D-tagatose/L-ribulose 3-epimerase n=1 Tax=Streptomyces iranensis TaxID=576784 RepID=A0A060ZAR7_9ACTN|nr:sugar phosphate isomerase/epimerase family protein [Streptomyces iranensis]MBP2068482.1 D-psicose/D-tagatose/L-ribulose 3-epimerase [Streptomyces iranensis]CDR01178.1 xylose isomerase domain-containing protein [Streptomyces iranensis]